MKKTFWLLISFLLSATLFAYDSIPARPDYVKNEFFFLRQAEHCFANGDYGQAMKLCDVAREYRRAKTAWEVYTLENSLRPREVVRAGDYIRDIKPVLEEREDKDALAIISRYEKNPRAASYTTYASNLLEVMKSQTELPEADFMTGNIYYIEGEYLLAKKYFDKAWENRALLDIPDQQFDILYRLADLSFMNGDEKAYEEYLTNIVRDDKSFKNENMQSSLLKIISANKKGSVDNLFNLFRPNNFLMIEAYAKLADYYFEKQVFDKAVYMSALACLASFTRMYDIVSERLPDFKYDGVANFFKVSQNYSDVLEWAENNNVARSFDSLEKYASASGYSNFCGELKSVLAVLHNKK